MCMYAPTPATSISFPIFLLLLLKMTASDRAVRPCLRRLCCFLFLFFSIFEARRVAGMQKSSNSSVSSFLVFGDSTVDPGNNNYVATIFKGNFRPYGRDFVDQTPTGRFCNGRLSTDYIVSYLGLKDYVPPFLDPTLDLNELISGVSFASAGSGFDPLTPKFTNVVPIARQMEYLKEYKMKLESAMGQERTENHINKALFLVSAGTNDYVINYFMLPFRRKRFSVASYHRFLVHHLKDFLQGLVAEGARKIAVAGLPPMGCLPMVMTLHSYNALFGRGCVDYYSSVAVDYNEILQRELNAMQTKLSTSGTKIFYIDVYKPLMELIGGLEKYGFDEGGIGCCGTGLLEASFLCNPRSYVCPDATKYVFWDSIHPTEAAYHHLFKAVAATIDAIIKS